MDDDNNSSTNDDLPKMPMPNKKHGGEANSNKSEDANLAADVIRQKLKGIYGEEPSASEELTEIREENHRLSRHQKFIQELQESGKSMVEVQTAWHEYYQSLPNHEKNKVWEEFYAANKQAANPKPSPHTTYIAAPEQYEPEPERRTKSSSKPKAKKESQYKIEPDQTEKKTAADVKKDLLSRVQNRSQNAWYQRFHSVIFGLGVGMIVLIIFLFSFFNERFIAPFITPSQNVSAQSLIIDPNGGSVGPNPLVIIPKINVEIPVIYTVPTIDENLIEDNLEDGVVHYPTTAYPGQNGNGAIFGHSSNNILNPGKYKFAFVLLHDLQVGDTFTLDYKGTAYVYQIFEKNIVSPNDVSILNNVPGHTATFTLITCDPPGTSINRLYVVGDQISPSISTNTAGPDQNSAPKPTQLPSNSPSLWSRVTSWL